MWSPNHTHHPLNLLLSQIPNLKSALLNLHLPPFPTRPTVSIPNFSPHKPPLQPHLRRHSAKDRQIRNRKQETDEYEDRLGQELRGADGNTGDVEEGGDYDRDGEDHDEQEIEFVC